jgi:hypothetical protein
MVSGNYRSKRTRKVQHCVVRCQPVTCRNRDGTERGDFLARFDVPNRSLYFTVATLRDDAKRRTKDNVKSSHWLWTEIDFRAHLDITPDDILRRLQAMPHSPTMIVASGHGYHVYWQFNEPVDAAPGTAQKKLSYLQAPCNQPSRLDPGLSSRLA